MQTISFTPDKLRSILEHSWSAETSANPAWTAANKPLGQCAVTACIVEDYFGGEILNTKAELPDGTIDSHYYNVIDGEEVDLSRDQFPEGTTFPAGQPKHGDYASTREYILSYPVTKHRYDILRERVDDIVSDI
jgi:hypothetical protein